jgi:hypothetical protein
MKKFIPSIKNFLKDYLDNTITESINLKKFPLDQLREFENQIRDQSEFNIRGNTIEWTLKLVNDIDNYDQLVQTFPEGLQNWYQVNKPFFINLYNQFLK